MKRIIQKNLSCGMPLIIEPNLGVRSVGVSLLLPAGHVREPDALEGLGALWSELLLRGAGTLDSRAQADAFDRLGASRAASAGTYHMHLSMTILGENLHDALGLLADMVLAPRMDDPSIEAARDLALQALASLDDDPQQKAFLGARARHRPSPLNRSGLGTEQTLKAMTSKDLHEQWRRFAVPGGAVIALAGAVDPDAVETRLNALFDNWSGTVDDLPLELIGPRGYAHETDDTNQVQVVVVHDAPAEADDNAWLERVVISILSGGMSSRLFTEVREKRGLCYSVNASYKTSRESGAVTAYVGTTPERAQQSLDVLMAELHRISQGVDAGEFARAVTGLKSQLVFSGESTSARAAALASDMARIGRPRALDELADRIDRITLDEVNHYLARRRIGRVTIQTLGPAPLVPPLD
ncbi:MAG: insulinase family protein [Phycisphaeraceae bacterium]|nr:insulinase family protein [Phycisphaeraceae bacterium]